MCKMDKIKKIAKNYNLKIIEDAAQAFGAKYKGKKAGTFSDVASFSFNVGKILEVLAKLVQSQQTVKKFTKW